MEVFYIIICVAIIIAILYIRNDRVKSSHINACVYFFTTYPLLGRRIIANYNKACNEKVHIWKADDVLPLIDLYGKGIKEFAEKEYYASGTLEKLIAQIMDTSQSGGAIDIKKAEKDAKNDEKAAAEAVKNALKKVNGIDFEGKTFVFAGAGKVDGTFYCYYDYSDPAIKEVIERGGIVNLKKIDC